VRRGDWCALAKELQSDVIKIILERREPKAAAELVTTTIKKLRAGEIPLAKMNFDTVPDMAQRRAAATTKRYPVLPDI
jgi:DNA polymerase elongation subunit (family B)